MCPDVMSCIGPETAPTALPKRKAFAARTWASRVVMERSIAGLAIEKFDEFGDDLIGGFFHQPVPGIADDHPFNIRRHEPTLLNQEVA